MWALIDGVAKAHQQSVGDLLGRVFATARTADGKFDTNDVLTEARALGRDSSTFALIEQILNKGFARGAEAMLATELGKLGIATRQVSPSKVPLQNFRHAEAFGRELSRCDCDGRISLTTTDEGLFFHDVPECPTLKDVRVIGYSANALPKDAGAAFDALVARKDVSAIELRVEGRAAPLKVKCRAGYASLPFTKLLEPI